MDAATLQATARALMDGDRGLIAMDESLPTCNKRFAPLGIPQTEDKRREWRDLIVTTPDLARCISGAILFDETLRQTTLAGVPFARALNDLGIVPGIKVDAGSKPLPNFSEEEVTEGLDGLRDRLAEYAGMGARFAKWRAVIRIGDQAPTPAAIAANAHALARYAALCQEAGIVPIVEPEVLMDGSHTLERCRAVSTLVLQTVFQQLAAQRVLLEGMLLKPNMVLPGKDAAATAANGDADIADATVETLLRTVPAAVPGVAFLSGGQDAKAATLRLALMHQRHRGRLPWALTFSYSRAIQQPALEIWRGDRGSVVAAQQALLHRADCNRAARAGHYDARNDAAADAPAAT